MKRAVLVAVFLAATCSLFAAGGNIPIYAAGTIGAAGHYYLTRDISGTITIDSDNVTFDLNGHNLTGNINIGSGATGHSKVKITNGTLLIGSISGLGGGKNITLTDLVLEGNSATTGNITFSYQTIQPENIVIENCRANAISLWQTRSARVAYCQVENPQTGNGGIYLYQSYAVVVEHNIVRNSSAYGIYVNQSYDCTISHNRVQNVTNGGGIYVNQSNGCTISHNQCTGNNIGIYLFISNGSNQIIYNNCSQNTTSGIMLQAGSSYPIAGDDISYNTCSYNGNGSNGYGGIYLESHASYNKISNNVCSKNTGLYPNGITVYTGAAYGRNSIDWNTCSGNTGSGIWFATGSTGNVYSHNRCLGNTVAGYTDGGTNTAVNYSSGNPTNF